ncbi:MAG TPA: hypothetical protein DHN33_03895 [Eubacteriaceae bacterium]|nr:hypothetical protein [Eubacteriaceae bacterium]
MVVISVTTVKGFQTMKDTLVKIAYYYYKQNYTQGEIAKKMSMSRQRVNRLLKRVREEGIIKIQIEGYNESYVELENMLENQFSIKRVIIVPDTSEDALYEALAMEGINYLKTIVKDHLNIGVSWGKTVYHLAQNLSMEGKKYENITVTQLVGGMSSKDGPRKSDEITYMIADKLGAKPYFLFAPTFVRNLALKEEYMKEESIIDVFRQIEKIDVALLSIGEVSKYSSSLKTHLIEDRDYNALMEAGSVGNISLRYFDENGEILDCDLNRSVVGIEAEQYRKIPEVVAICGGKEKEKAILAALRGGYIDTLITNETTARQVLALNKGKVTRDDQ